MSQTENENRTQGARHISLPTMWTSFIGRKHETEDIARLLMSSRLVTLTGAAGCGKTRLGLRVAADMSHNYADGVHWIELARLADSGLVPQAVARALNVAGQPGRPLEDLLSDALRGKSLLLVLDNCEHLLDACAHLTETLLVATGVSMLATSREPLSIFGEMLYPVTPLSLPPPSSTTDDIGQYEAIQLFVERAQATLPGFALTPDNASAVASVCRNLDGIPLAIELASARVNVLTVEQIAARLNDRFELLQPAAHVTRSHHRTLRAAVDWSYDALSIPEQVMLRRLSVFAAGCSLATAEAICAADCGETERALDLLSSLVNKSLVMAETLQRGEARYSLLETVRQYAGEKLGASGESSMIHDRHLERFLQLTEETALKITGPYQQLWLNWLESEYNNVRAALTWSLESGRIEAGLRIAVALYQFWTIRDYVEEGLAWFERLLARADEAISAVVRAKSLAYAAFLAGFRGNLAAQMAYGREAAAIAETAGDEGKPALIWALAAQAHGARAIGDHQTEFTLGEQVIQGYRELGEPYFLGISLSTYSFTAMSLERYEAARNMLDEGLTLLREAGDPYRIAMALNFSGDLARCERNYVGAIITYEESISLLRELNAPRDLASVVHNLGYTCLYLGDVERAHALFIEALGLHQTQQNTLGIAECLIGFAALAIARNVPAAGARVLAAAVAIGGQHTASMWAATRMEYEHYLALARGNLTETEFQAEQAAGRAFSLERALTYAQDVATKATASQAIRKQPDELTAREREVAALIAEGKSNAEIADELVVSKRTVEKHIANIRSKLGFSERTQIVRWAVETQLVNIIDVHNAGE